MNELSCYDLNGNSVTGFTQWDTGQKIIVDGQFTTAPFVDFGTRSLDFAYRMNSELLSDGRIKVEVPNVLLTQEEAILMYVYSYEDNTTGAIEKGRTEYINRFPVKQRVKPEDYIYVNNVELVSLLALRQRLLNLEETIKAAEINRASAESNRQSAEQERVTNENQRITDSENLKRDSQELMKKHQAALDEVPKITEKAKQYAEEAKAQKDVVVNSAAEKISEIENTASEQIKNISTKGVETLDSIPDDYSSAIADINTLKEDLEINKIFKTSNLLAASVSNFKKNYYYSASANDFVFRNGNISYIHPILAGEGETYVSNASAVVFLNSENSVVSHKDAIGASVESFTIYTAPVGCKSIMVSWYYTEDVSKLYFAKYDSGALYTKRNALTKSLFSNIDASQATVDGSKLTDAVRGKILEDYTDTNTTYDVDIKQGVDFIVKINPKNANVTISEITKDGVQNYIKYSAYISNNGLYRFSAETEILGIRFTDMTEKIEISVYLPNDNESLEIFFPEQFRPDKNIEERNTVSGYRINALEQKIDTETGNITFYDVSGCEYIRISPFRFYGTHGCAFFSINGFVPNITTHIEQVKIIDSKETLSFQDMILKVPDGCNYFGMTWLNENNYTPKVTKLSFAEKENSNLQDFYGIFKNFSIQNGYSLLSLIANSAKSTSLTSQSLKKVTKNDVAFGHMGQLVIKDGICYASFLQNIGNDGEATYSKTSELVIAKFLLSDALSNSFSPDANTQIKVIGKLGSACAGHIAKSIYKDNAMCLIGNKLYITFMFISETDSDAHLFRKVYNINSDTFEDEAVCEIEYKGKTYPFTNSTINMIYEENHLNQNASGIMEIVSEWSEYNSEYYATGINGEKPNNGFVIKTTDFKKFYFVDVLPFNDNGIAEIASIVHDNKLYVACRQNYSLPYLLLNFYDLQNSTWGTPYRIQDGNVRPWFYKKDGALYLINTIEEYYRRYTNISNVLTSGYLGSSAPIKIIATLYNCGSYIATSEYDGNTYYVCTYNGTIYFGKLDVIQYNDTAINNKLLKLLE